MALGLTVFSLAGEVSRPLSPGTYQELQEQLQTVSATSAPAGGPNSNLNLTSNSSPSRLSISSSGSFKAARASMSGYGGSDGGSDGCKAAGVEETQSCELRVVPGVCLAVPVHIPRT